jgi:hypothetical protein
MEETRLPETAMPRLIALAVAGKGDEAMIFAGHMIPRGAPLSGLRDQVKSACSSTFWPHICAALPWLAGESFNPRPDKGQAAAARSMDDVFAMLDEAGWRGLPKRDFLPSELEGVGGMIAEVSQPTKGRPKTMIRLKVHDVRHNGFAMPGDY